MIMVDFVACVLFLCVLGFVDWCRVWTRALLGLNTYSLDVFPLVVINMVN